VIDVKLIRDAAGHSLGHGFINFQNDNQVRLVPLLQRYLLVPTSVIPVTKAWKFFGPCSHFYLSERFEHVLSKDLRLKVLLLPEIDSNGLKHTTRVVFLRYMLFFRGSHVVILTVSQFKNFRPPKGQLHAVSILCACSRSHDLH
jgi:hypothetical protein